MLNVDLKIVCPKPLNPGYATHRLIVIETIRGRGDVYPIQCCRLPCNKKNPLSCLCCYYIRDNIFESPVSSSL